MSVTSGFFNSLNGDRRYTAEQFSELINTLVNDGVFQNVATAFSVTATSGNEITVGIGRCWFNGVWLMNDALYPMALRDSELLLNRIDAVVIEINHSESVRAGSIRLISGTPASDPQRPSLVKTDDIHQYPLAYIYRKAGVNEVVQADITNMIGTSECPYITGILETQDIDKIVAQWESQFNIWFEGVQDILDSDTAAKLAAQLIELDNRFETLAKERAVYEELEDSSGDKVMDSMSSPIQARTVMAAAGETQSRTIIPVMTDNTPKVGDTLTTARTDLGDSWFLCNGEPLDREQYTELASVLPPTPSSEWSEPATILNMNTTSANMIYANGKYVIVAAVYKNGIYAVSSTNTTGPWTTTTIKNGVSTPYTSKLMYINGYYVVAFSYYTDSNYVNIAYTNNPTGTWTVKNIVKVTGNNNVQLVDFVYLNGYYVLLMSKGIFQYARIAYTTDPFGSWTDSNLASDGSDIVGICYAENRYVMLVKDSSTCSVRTASSLGSSWTTASSIGAYEPSFIGYLDGKYFVYNDSSMSYSYSVNGPWITKYLSHPYPNNPSQNESITMLQDIVYLNDLYIALGTVDVSTSHYAGLSYSADPMSIGNILVKVSDSPKSQTSQVTSIVSVNGKYTACMRNYTGSNTVVQVADCSQDLIRLPEISLSNDAYTYIKVRSGN